MSIDFTSGGIDFTVGQQGQQGYNPTSQDLQSAVTQFANTSGDPSQNFLPNLPTFTLGSDTQDPGQVSSTVNPFDLAGQGASSVMPFLQQQKDSGIFQDHPNAGKPTGLEGQFDLIGSMVGGGGGYTAQFNPTSLNPQIASMLEGTKYADMYNPGGPSTYSQSNVDELVSHIPSVPRARFNPNTEINDLIKDDPRMMEFYNAAPTPGMVDVQVDMPQTREEMEAELMSAPKEGLGDAINQDYSELYDIGGGMLSDNSMLGGSLSDQMGMTEDLMADFAGPQISNLMPDRLHTGSDANLGITQNDDGTFNVPDQLGNIFGDDSSLMEGLDTAVAGFEMPDWAPQGIGLDLDQVSDMTGGIQDVGQGPQLDIPGNMSSSVDFLQQFLPDMYPTE